MNDEEVLSLYLHENPDMRKIPVDVVKSTLHYAAFEFVCRAKYLIVLVFKLIAPGR